MEKEQGCDYCSHKGKDAVTGLRWWCGPLMQYVDGTRPKNCPRIKDTYGPCWNVKLHKKETLP